MSFQFQANVDPFKVSDSTTKSELNSKLNSLDDGDIQDFDKGEEPILQVRKNDNSFEIFRSDQDTLLTGSPLDLNDATKEVATFFGISK